MAFVLDNSVAMAWCFEDDASEYSDRVLDRLKDEEALTPAIWPLEATNALLTGVRRHRLQVADTIRLLDLLRALPITVDQMSVNRAVGPVMDLARTYNLSAYDASYLELAMREGVPLATQDARLISAAESTGVRRL